MNFVVRRLHSTLCDLLALCQEKMPLELLNYCRLPSIGHPTRTEPHIDQEGFLFRKVFSIIHAGVGHDFANYKRNTTRRRIERRLAVHQIENMEGYVSYSSG